MPQAKCVTLPKPGVCHFAEKCPEDRCLEPGLLLSASVSAIPDGQMACQPEATLPGSRALVADPLACSPLPPRLGEPRVSWQQAAYGASDGRPFRGGLRGPAREPRVLPGAACKSYWLSFYFSFLTWSTTFFTQSFEMLEVLQDQFKGSEKKS